MIELTVIKTAGNWELDVLAIPYGSPNQKDSDGQYFTPDTQLYLDHIKSPMVLYYHAYTPDGKPQGEPEIIGQVKDVSKKSDGVWVRVLLDRLSAYAKRVWEAATKGHARASSGSVNHLARAEQDGRITHWPFVEISIFDADGKRQPANQYAVALPAAKAVFAKAGQDLELPDTNEPEPEADAEGEQQSADAVEESTNNQAISEETMDDKEILSQVNEAVKAALEEQRKAADEAAKQADAIKARVAEEIKAEREKWEKEAAAAGRLSAPVVTKFADVSKFDDLGAADMGMLHDVLKSKGAPVSQAAMKALVIKMREEKSAGAESMRRAAKGAGLPDDFEQAVKAATDPMYSGGSNIGSDWVGTGYSNQLWETVRAESRVASKIPQVIIPDGYSSTVFPLESSDPTFYKVAEVTAADSTMKVPAATVTASQAATANKQLTIGKLGARVMYSGELIEDSLIPVLPQLRAQLELKGAEVLDHVIIDGDNATDASTNINDIAGTPAGTEPFMLWDGMRYIALATSGQNRSAGGGLSTADYLETMRLLGTAGVGALDPSKCGFIIDANTYWASMKLEDVKTRDVFGAATLENGQLRGLWGYPILASNSMHYYSAARKANSAGKVDQDTTANNAYGAILAVRWDGWKLGYKRRMTFEVTRMANSDSYEIVGLMRVGLAYRDTTSTAISYYVGV